MKPAAKDGILPPRLPKGLALAGLAGLEYLVEISQVRLVEGDFSGVQAAGVLFEQVHIRRTVFLQARLERLRLFDCRLEGCECSGAVWEKARLRRVELAGCRMLGTDFAEGSFEDVRFSDCIMEGAVFGLAGFKSVRFEGCNL